MGEIIEFIKRHWVWYLVGALLAIGLGLGVSLMILKIGTTPGSAHAMLPTICAISRVLAACGGL